MVPGDVHDLEFVGGGVAFGAAFLERYRAALRAVIPRGVRPTARTSQFAKDLSAMLAADPEDVARGIVAPALAGSWDFPHADAFRAMPEVWQLVQIAEQLLPDLMDLDVQRMFGKGHTHPAMDGRSAFSRDAQFERYAAALCRAGGRMVSLVEPDFEVSLQSGPLGVAVKRVRERPAGDAWSSAVAKRLEEGEAQIVQSGRPGVVLLDATLLVNPGSEWVGHWRNDPIGKLVRHLTRMVSTELGDVFRSRRHPLVAGHVVHLAHPVILGRFKWGFLEVWLPVPHEGWDSKRVWEFLHLIDAGVARASAPRGGQPTHAR